MSILGRGTASQRGTTSLLRCKKLAPSTIKSFSALERGKLRTIKRCFSGERFFWGSGMTESKECSCSRLPQIFPLAFDRYVWGDVLPDLAAADVRIINLENAMTTSDDWAKVSASRMPATTHEPF